MHFSMIKHKYEDANTSYVVFVGDISITMHQTNNSGIQSSKSSRGYYFETINDVNIKSVNNILLLGESSTS
jgi:hypothetical protein